MSGFQIMPRLAVRAIIIEDGRILLCRHETRERSWYVTPGGGVRHGETIEEAFHREMQEELGVECKFGEIEFVREFITNRHPESGLDPDFHEIEVFVQSRLVGEPHFQAHAPDRDQVGIEWIELRRLGEITFYPIALTEAFRTQTWEKIYYGEMQ